MHKLRQCAEVCYKAMEMAGKYKAVEEVVKEIEKDKPFYEELGSDLFRGEPFMQPAFERTAHRLTGRIYTQRLIPAVLYKGYNYRIKQICRFIS